MCGVLQIVCENSDGSPHYSGACIWEMRDFMHIHYSWHLSHVQAKIALFTTARAVILEGAQLLVHSLLGDESQQEAVPPHNHEASRLRGKV